MKIENSTALEELKKEEMYEIRGGGIWGILGLIGLDRVAQGCCSCGSIFSRYGLFL